MALPYPAVTPVLALANILPLPRRPFPGAPVRGSLTIAKIDAIPLEVHLTWPPVFLFIAWSLAVFLFPSVVPGLSSIESWLCGFLASLLLFGSLVAHELGHAAFARRHRIEVRRINVFFLGGFIEIDLGDASPLEEAGVALAGPAVNLALGLLYGGSWLLLRSSGLVLSALLLYLALCNLLLGLFNLLPGYPLDGGRILRAGLWHLTGDPVRATRWSSRLGVGIGVGSIGLGMGCAVNDLLFVAFWLVAAGIFLLITARGSGAPSPTPPPR